MRRADRARAEPADAVRTGGGIQPDRFIKTGTGFHGKGRDP
jgi:hypothetical protein